MKRGLLFLILAVSILVGLCLFTHSVNTLADSTDLTTQESDLSKVTFTWENASNIQATFPTDGTLGVTTSGITVPFYDDEGITNLYGKSTLTYYSGTSGADVDTCSTNQSTLSNVSPADTNGTAHVFWSYLALGATQSGCTTYTETKSIVDNQVSTGSGSIAASKIIYEYSGDTIQTTDSSVGLSKYTEVSGYPDVYSQGGGCSPEIVVGTDGTATLWDLTGAGDGNANVPNSDDAKAADAEGCGINYPDQSGENANGINDFSVDYVNAGSKNDSNNAVTVFVPGLKYITPTAANTTPGGGTTTGTTGTAPGPTPPTCEASGWNLSWLVCPVVNAIQDLEQAIEGAIGDLLATPTISFNNNNCSSSTGDCIYKAWSSFRLLANLVLVIALLVLVYVESAGGGVAQAYTIKKMLPRILIAAILINLSIYIVAGLEDITNVLGRGIFSLISDAFGGSGWKIQPSGFGVDLMAPLIGVAAFWAAGGEALVFIGLFIGLPVLFAALAIVVTLVLRQGIIVLLIMASPVAFALYCLPNTEQYFRKWWDLLFKTLLVYPIVMIAFALADVTGVIISALHISGAQYSWIPTVIGIIATVAPLFLIPYAFKIAGGVVGGLHDTLHGFGTKSHEAIKGNVNDQNSLRNRTRRNLGIRNTVRGMTWGQVGTRLNPNRVTRQGRENARARISGQRAAGLAQLQNQIEQTGFWQATAANDSNVGGALAFFENGRQARGTLANWNYAETARINSDPALTAAQRTTQLDDMNRVYRQRESAIAQAERIGYNPASRRAALVNPNTVGFEFERGQAGWNQALTAMDSISGGDEFQFRSMMDQFQGVAKTQAGRADLAGNVDGSRTYDLDRATGSQGLYQFLNGKPRAVEGLIDEHVNRLQAAGSTDDERRQSAIFLNEMRNASSKNQGTAGARDAINGRMAAMNAAYNNYTNDTVNNQLATGAVPIARQESVEVTTPGLGGSSETRRETRTVPLTGTGAAQDAARRAEASRRLENEISTASRSYTPPDINNMP
jgi:hypothetical protein